MGAWSEVRSLAPELSVKVQARFDASGLGLLATIRSNGFPRISGIEPMFADDLWLGMMPDSRKAKDLMNNPRLCLHSATEDKNVAKGDAKVAGLGTLVEQDEVVDGFRRAFADHAGAEPPPGPMHLFRVHVTEMSFVRPNVDHLVVEWWKQGGFAQAVKRY